VIEEHNQLWTGTTQTSSSSQQ